MFEPIVFDPSQTTVTIDNAYITGFGGTAISFSYSQDAVSAESGLDGATVFTVNNSKLGTCTLPMKISSPQFEKLMALARNHTMFSIWCTDKSSGRRLVKLCNVYQSARLYRRCQRCIVRSDDC